MRRRTLIVVLCLVAAGTAQGAVLYKLTDRDGHVTYVQSVPKDFEGDVKRLDIDLGPGTIDPNEPRREVPRLLGPTDAESAQSFDAKVRAARIRAQAAREAFESARDNSTPDDWVYVGPNNPLGMRRFPKPEYQARLARLEDAAKRAEEEVERLERAR